MGYRIILSLNTEYQGFPYSVKILASQKVNSGNIRRLNDFWCQLSVSTSEVPYVSTSNIYYGWPTLVNGLYSHLDLECVGYVQDMYDNLQKQRDHGLVEIKGNYRFLTKNIN